MGQPQTQTEIALEEFRQAGVPIQKARRPYHSKRMTGFNAEVYSAWIERWANNAATNYAIARNSDGVAFLKNCAKDVPAIVIGIGPGLDEQIADLKRAPRHAVIIATDAALRPLVRHGIHPDLVVNYDARDHQKSMWDSIDTSPYVLLANTVTSPLTIDAWEGGLMCFNMMQSDDEFATNILPALFPHLGQLPNMGTVGNGAVFLAYLMGCRPIFGVGMDLCYKEVWRDLPDQSARGEGSPALQENRGWRYRCADFQRRPSSGVLGQPEEWDEVENRELYDNDARLAETFNEEIKGKTYKVDQCLQHYRHSLLAGIGQYDIPFIDCSGGVLTDLVKSMPLRDALETKCYGALEPGRTVAKHLRAILQDPREGWTLHQESRLFIPQSSGWTADDTPRGDK